MCMCVCVCSFTLIKVGGSNGNPQPTPSIYPVPWNEALNGWICQSCWTIRMKATPYILVLGLLEISSILYTLLCCSRLRRATLLTAFLRLLYQSYLISKYIKIIFIIYMDTILHTKFTCYIIYIYIYMSSKFKHTIVIHN